MTTTMAEVDADVATGFMPLAASQAPSQGVLTPSVVLMVELSGNLYGSWGTSFADAINMPQHQAMLSLWLWVWDRAIESDATVFLETVVDAREATDPVKPHCFRLWVPLTESALMQFVTNAAGAMPMWIERDPQQFKRPRLEPRAGAARLQTRAHVLSALRAYHGAVALADVGTAVSVDGEALPQNHIVTMLDARRRLQRCQRAYCDGGVPEWQRQHTAYLGSGGRLSFPDEVVRRGLVRELRPGFVRRADHMLVRHLPHLAPSAAQTAQAQCAVAHATGCDDVELATDPTAYSSLRAATGADDVCALEALLRDIYPIIERVKQRNRRRIASCGLQAVAAEIVKELDTLYSIQVTGVPDVYTSLRQERARRLQAMRGTGDDVTDDVRLARKMFWRGLNPTLTTWGNTMASIVGGICTAARMLPAQRKLWLLLFLRSHKCTANHVGSNAYIIAVGPPETGKSEACKFWLACMPNALQRMNDGQSAKAHTAHDPEGDMRVCFQDELQEHVNGDNNNDNAKQTLISNGLLVTKRLQKQDDGSFALEETKKAGRALTVTCTNNLCDVKDAVKSRATIVAVPAVRHGAAHTSAATLASIGTSKANALRAGFALFCQAIACFQVDFWALEAAGTLAVDDRMVLLYKTIADKMLPERGLSARKMVEIRHLATSIMVLDLCCAWHRFGQGRGSDGSAAGQVVWFARNAVVKMEHVLAAVGVSTDSTCVRSELQAVQNTLRGMVRMDVVGYPVMSADQTGYVLATSRRRLQDDVADSNTALGQGLTKTLLRSIQQASTDGRPNVRIDVDDRQEVVLLNRAYAATFVSPTDEKLLAALALQVAQATDAWHGDYHVFRSSVRHMFTDTSENGARGTLLRGVTQSELRLALAIMGDRRNEKGEPQWVLRDSCAVARVTAHDVPGSVVWPDGTRRVRKVEQCVLLVDKRLLGGTTDVDTSPLSALYQTCLAVAGGYEGKQVVVGLGPGARGMATIGPAKGRVSVEVCNPLHSDKADLQLLLGEDVGPDDSVFPRSAKTLCLTENSHCERQCFADLASCQ
ncbi:hypothetical protein [Nereida ignava]|uniref:hypothetical protein n=1 Tax=Nereida ignava TaxID=282199 RepID=UPI0030F4DC2B